jgi:hypothetical protein
MPVEVFTAPLVLRPSGALAKTTLAKEVKAAQRKP